MHLPAKLAEFVRHAGNLAPLSLDLNVLIVELVNRRVREIVIEGMRAPFHAQACDQFGDRVCYIPVSC